MNERRWGQQKPVPGAQPNYGSPVWNKLLHLWMFNEGGGMPRDWGRKNNSDVVSLNGGVKWAGGGLRSDGVTGSYAPVAGTAGWGFTDATIWTAVFSFVCWDTSLNNARLLDCSAIVGGGHEPIFGVGSNIGGSGISNSVGIDDTQSAAGVMVCPANSIVNGKRYVVAFTTTVIGGTHTRNIWINGVNVPLAVNDSSGGGFTDATNGNARTFFTSNSASSASRDHAANATIFWCGIWDRVLTLPEIQDLTLKPYDALFEPPVWRRYFVPASGGVSGSAASRSGGQGQDVGTRSASAAATARAGARAQDAGARTATSGAASESGARAQDVGARSASLGVTARTGSRGQDVGVRAAALGVATQTGSRGQDAGAKAASAGVVGSAGARAQCVGFKSVSTANVTKSGARGQDVGARSTSAGADSRSGAQGLAAGLQGGIKFAFGRAGSRAQDAGSRNGVGSAASRVGIRAATSGSATQLDQRTGTAVARAGVRSQCAGFRAVSTAAVGRAGCTARNAGARFTSAGSHSSAGGRGLCSSAPAPAPPSGINNEECVVDYALPDAVTWPPGVEREVEVVGQEVILVGCETPAGAIAPWSI